MAKNRKMVGFKKGKFNLTCFIHGHLQDHFTYGGKRFKCDRCGATWDKYIY